MQVLEKVMVPKPGLYEGGLLNSLMTWAIPASFPHETEVSL